MGSGASRCSWRSALLVLGDRAPHPGPPSLARAVVVPGRSRDIPAEVRRALREDAPAWIVAAAVGLVVLSVLGSNGWRETPDGMVSGGWNWSDLLVHVAIGNSIVHGNFPPEVPYFAGRAADLPLVRRLPRGDRRDRRGRADHPGLLPLERAAGRGAGARHVVPRARAHEATGAWPRSPRSSCAPAAGWAGCDWARTSWRAARDIAALITQNPYDNSWADGWPFFRIASVFGTGFLPHRATTFGLPGLVAVVLLVVTCLGRRPAGVLLAGVLAALLAPFHFYAFPAVYLIVGLYVVTSGAWRAADGPRATRVLFLAPVVAGAAATSCRPRSGRATRARSGSSRAGARRASRDGPAAVVFFYVTNLGIPVLLAIACLLVLRGADACRIAGSWISGYYYVRAENSASDRQRSNAVPEASLRIRDLHRLLAMWLCTV